MALIRGRFTWQRKSSHTRTDKPKSKGADRELERKSIDAVDDKLEAGEKSAVKFILQQYGVCANMSDNYYYKIVRDAVNAVIAARQADARRGLDDAKVSSTRAAKPWWPDFNPSINSQSTALEIFGTNGVRLSITHTDPRGIRSMVELHTSIYHIVEDGDMIIITDVPSATHTTASAVTTQQAASSTPTERPAADVKTAKIITRETLLAVPPEYRHLVIDWDEFLRNNRGGSGPTTKEAHQEPFYYAGMPGYD